MPGLQDLSVRLAELLDIPESEALRITSRFIPVITLESIVGLPTTRVRGLVGSPCLGYESQPAVAAEFSHVQLFNPTDSGIEIHVERVLITTTVTTSTNVRRLDTPLTTLAPNVSFSDFRVRGRPVGEIRTETNVAQLGTLLGEIGSLAGEVEGLEFSPMILGENQGVLIASNLVNREVRSFFFWREV